MSESPLVTVTVCARDGAHWVEDCLDAIFAQTHRPLEIIAVNDGSNDSTGLLMDQWQQSKTNTDVAISIIHQDAIGLSAGRMAALNQAQGEWVAITDIDVRPEQDWIEHLLKANVPVGEERIVAVTGRTIFQTHTDLVSRFRAIEIASKYRSRPRRTSLANGPCSMFHRQTLLDVGGFDPEWYHAEDMEVSLRLLNAGGSIVYAPDALVSHVPEVGVRRFLRKRRRDARAHVRIVRHHPSRQRTGPGFDFIGSASIALSIFPITLLMLASVIPLFLELPLNQPLQEMWQTQLALGGLMLGVLVELMFWRGPLGVITRSMKNDGGKSGLLLAISVRILILRWSIALWQGLILGCIDAIFARNGHKRLFR
ncbi:MAG: glycosyltransferase family 2 protein [Candidatus Poseidoniaceae archaeon]